MPGEELNFEFAIFYSMALNAGVTIISVSLIFSGGLRLISLIKNSEAYGLQLLGLEQEAIVKIRLITFGTLAIFQIISFGFLGAMPGMFSTFHGQENKSLIKDIEGNKYTSLILLVPTLALLVNAVTRFYSYKINQQMEGESLVFVVFGNPRNKALQHEDTFMFSSGFVLVIPLIISFSILNSFSTRHLRLTFFCPFQITCFSLVLPFVFILNNRKMKKSLWMRYFDHIARQNSCMLNSLQKQSSSRVAPLAHPNQI